MLLSRLAETMFWLGRYVERAEDLSRVIVAHEQLYLDMPNQAATWRPLLALCGSDSEDDDQLSAASVVRALAKGVQSGGSIFQTLHNAREDLRLSRPLLPRESWQTLTAARDALDDLPANVSLTATCRALSRIVEQCQRLTAQVDGCMSRDESYSFLKMGRMLERADITLRVIVMLGDVLSGKESASLFANVRWIGTLKYLAADQTFLRRYPARTERSVAIKFLLFDRWFPRSVYYCLTEIERELEALPNNGRALDCCQACHQQESTVDVLRHVDTYASHGLTLVSELSDVIDKTFFHPLLDLGDELPN